MRGSHYLKGWSSTQKTIALSSGEAELVAMVKINTELLGILQMMEEWDQTSEGGVWADSTTALAVVNRKGSGKLRHVKIGNLWIQQKREEGELEYKKVVGTENPADILTKHVNAKDLENQLDRLGMMRTDGRAQEGLKI